MKRKINALASIGLALALLTAPVHAAGSLTKDESVYAFLNSDGTVAKVTVSDWLHSDDGFANYDDASILKDVTNLRSDDAPQASQDGYVWSTSATDLYYQGTADADLPLAVRISYQLDGKDVQPADILGQSGHLKITLGLTNRSSKTEYISGAYRRIYLPLVCVAGIVLKSADCSKVTASTGTVQSDSTNQIAAAVLMPGMRDSLGGLLNGQLGDLESYLIDEVSVEAEVTSFESPVIMIAAGTNIADLRSDADLGQLSGALADLDKLSDATKQLIDGASSLAAGAAKTDAGAGEALAGATALADGLGKLSANSAGLNAGAGQIADGILSQANASLQAAGLDPVTWDNYATELGKDLGITDKMREEARQAILAKVNAGLKQAGQDTIDEDTLNILLYMAAVHNDPAKDLTGNIQAQAASLAAVGEKAAALANARSEAADPLSAATVKALLAGARSLAAANPAAGDLDSAYAGLLAKVKAAAAGSGLSFTDDQAAQALAYAADRYAPALTLEQNLAQGIGAVAQGTAPAVSDPRNDQAVIGLLTGIYRDTVNNSSDATMYNALAAKIQGMDASLSAEDIAVLICYAADNYDQAKTLDQNLAACGSFLKTAKSVNGDVAAVKSGAGDQVIAGLLTQTVASTQADQLKELKSLLASLTGVDTFVKGLKEYTGGVDTAAAGAQSLEAGLTELKGGTAQVAAGAQSLYEGIQKYNADGISKLTDNNALNNLGTASDVLAAIKEYGDSYNNYSGISEGTEGKVKFVLKVSETTAAKPVAAEDTGTAAKESFWDRIAALFR